MRSRRRIIGIGIVVLVVLGVVVAVATRSQQGSAVRPIRVGAVLTPRTPLFGDTVTARVEFSADNRRVVPGSVRVRGIFAPFRTVAEPVIERKGTGTTEYVVWSARLRCLARPCLPERSEKRVAFPPVRITYLPRGAEPAVAKSINVRWPTLIVYSRVDPIEIEASDPRDEPPWRADLGQLLAVSYDVPPTVATAALFGAGGLLALAAAGLVVPLRRREEEPEVVLEASLPEEPETPFEHALALLEREPARDESADARRRALEFVAAELGRRGQRELEASARQLAWAEHTPSLRDASSFVRKVRGAVSARSAE